MTWKLDMSSNTKAKESLCPAISILQPRHPQSKSTLPLTGDFIQGCRGCEIEVVGGRLSFALVLLDMPGFDVILGMDWLSSYCAVIDCYHQRVTVGKSSGDCFYFMGDIQ